jgi:hypothetical protein
VLAAVVSATLEHVHEAFNIGIDIGPRIVDRIAHAGLRCEMHHLLETMGLEQLRYAATIGEVKLHKGQFRVVLEKVKARELQRGIVIGLRFPIKGTPACSRICATWKPMKPAAPVTTIAGGWVFCIHLFRLEAAGAYASTAPRKVWWKRPARPCSGPKEL